MIEENKDYKCETGIEKTTVNMIKPVFNDENSINIVFCPDNKYVKYFGVLLQSIIDNSNPDKKYDLLIFETDIENRNKKLLLNMLPENFSLRFFNITEYISENFGKLNFNVKKYWSISTFYRLFVPFITDGYKKLLYLDSDMCVNHNIDELFEIDMRDKELIAVRDTFSPILDSNISRRIYMCEELGLNKPDEYFNAGMVLFNFGNIDIDKYRNSLKKAFEIKDLWFLDQDIMNIIFEDKTKLIHNRYNFMLDGIIYNKNFVDEISGEYKNNYVEAMGNPYIVHYSGGIKPWSTVSEEYSDIFWKYARKTPFYEEIIYTNTKTATLGRDVIKNAVNRHKIYLQYIRCKLLKELTFGNKKEHYRNKVAKLKQQITDYRKTLEE